MQGSNAGMQQGSEGTEEDRRPQVRHETFCPYCHADTTASAYVHPEFRTRYCSHAHADAHVGVAAWYTLHRDWTCDEDLPRGPWPALDVPPNVVGEPIAAPSGMLDGADVAAQVLAGMAREAYPTHCAACGKLLDPNRTTTFTSMDGTKSQGHWGDVRDAEFPFCRGCYHGGQAFDHQHAETIGILHAYGLATAWWNTGGGCWILVVLRADADGKGPDSWADDEDGAFGPFVGIMGAHHDGTEWHCESGQIDPGEDLGAMAFRTEDDWDGTTTPPQVAGVSVHDLAAFALAYLPTA